jgi:hypothetical protein
MPVRRLITIAVATLASLAMLGCEPIETTEQGGTQNGRTSARNGQVGRGNKKGCGSATIQVQDAGGNYRILLRKTKGNGNLTVVFTVNGKRVESGSITASSGVISISYANQ